jgi:cardiolipin synthase
MREANVVVEDRKFAQELRESLLERVIDGARPVAPARWRRRPLHQRMRIWIAYGIARFFIGWFGYGGKH